MPDNQELELVDIQGKPDFIKPQMIINQKNVQTATVNDSDTSLSVGEDNYSETLTIEVDKSNTKEGTFDSSRPMVISFGNLTAGQKLKVILTVNIPGTKMDIIAPNNKPVDVYAKDTLTWEGSLPLTGDYRIKIVSPLEGAIIKYRIKASLLDNIGNR